MQSASTVYAIFWEPPKLPDGTTTHVSTNYNSLIQRYFKDVGGSGLYNINIQYYQITNGATNYIVNSSTLGGAWIDTSTSYPSPSDCTDSTTPHGCLTDSDIRNEITKAISTNKWSGGLKHIFVVFTAWGEGSCADSTSSQCFAVSGGYCSYHFNFSNNGQTTLYSYIPYFGTISNSTGCSVPQSPNNDLDADRAISAASHEQMDTVTDPVGTAWFDSTGNTTGEIADKCIDQFGSVTLDNGKANVQWNGHYYIVQQEWSNATGDCRLSFANWAQIGFTAAGGLYNPYENTLSAANVSTLALDWFAQTGGPVASYSPAVANGVVYVGSNSKKLYAFKEGCNSGGGSCTPLWTGNLGSGINSNLTSPAVVNGVVYAGDGKLFAFKVGCNSGGGSCTPLWTAQTGKYVATSPAVANGVVYVGSSDNKLEAFAVGCNSGGGSCTPLWTGQAAGYFSGTSPTVANGVVYIGAYSASTVYAFKVGCNSGGGSCTPLWTAQPGGYVSSAAVVANGVVYVDDEDGNLYSFHLPGTTP